MLRDVRGQRIVGTVFRQTTMGARKITGFGRVGMVVQVGIGWTGKRLAGSGGELSNPWRLKCKAAWWRRWVGGWSTVLGVWGCWVEC